MSCQHDHDCGAQECAGAFSLYRHVDLQRVRCLNEAPPGGAAPRVFRPWEQRRAAAAGPGLRSNPDDPELLIHVPFDGAVKLRAIVVVGGAAPSAEGGGGAAPDRLRVFVNRDGLDFAEAAGAAPAQEWALQEDPNGVLEYTTQVTRFNGVHSLDLHFPSNHARGGATHISFVGLKGEFSERQRRAVDAVYEARPVPTDHKVPGGEAGAGWNVGM